MTVMRVMVTGASGLIGAHVIEALLELGAEPVACDIARFPPPGVGSSNVPFVRVDVSDLDALSSTLEHYRIERIVHSAALLARTCQEDPPLAARVNVMGHLNVLEAARRLGIGRVIMASSMAVYGNTTGGVVEETHPCNPTTVYGAAKVFAEACGRAYRSDHGIEFIALRYGATYGPGPPQPCSRGVATDLREFFEGAVRSGEVNLSELDYLKRPLVYVKDAAGATALACCGRKSPHSSIFNVAGNGSASLAECAEVLARLLPGLRITRRAKPAASGPIRPQSVSLSVERAKAELGYQPRYALERGISEYVQWLQRDKEATPSDSRQEKL